MRLRGQQVRYISQLLEAARTAEAVPLLLNTPTRGLSTGDGGYEGAVVNDPMCGFHKFPVVTLAWMSLYPSLMQAHNLCPSTLVRDPKLVDMDGVVAHRVSATRTTHFQTQHKGILPRILESLLGERKLAKQEVKRYAKLAKEGDATAEAEELAAAQAEAAAVVHTARLAQARTSRASLSPGGGGGAAAAIDPSLFDRPRAAATARSSPSGLRQSLVPPRLPLVRSGSPIAAVARARPLQPTLHSPTPPCTLRLLVNPSACTPPHSCGLCGGYNPEYCPRCEARPRPRRDATLVCVRLSAEVYV